VVLKISVSVAACFIIGLLTYLAFSIHTKPKLITVPVVKTVSGSMPHKVELLSNNTRIPISQIQQIISEDAIKTLLINGKNKMVMNIGTSLSIEQLTINSNLGCLVKLDSGEIYTHVEHDGNPFIVDTVNCQAVITGTTFDIKAKNTKTTLIVSEGMRPSFGRKKAR
jgi:hypothetical protein